MRVTGTALYYYRNWLYLVELLGLPQDFKLTPQFNSYCCIAIGMTKSMKEYEENMRWEEVKAERYSRLTAAYSGTRMSKPNLLFTQELSRLY